jgi:8-oxo-dGTP pyrophosphatase MutT (NUDIX family)
MNFTLFLSKIAQYKTAELDGLDAQFKLAPKLRTRLNNESINARNPKKAGVLALFYPNKQEEVCFLLTKRAYYNGTHSAQISFPGGKFEEGDKTLKNTALRESFEEVGIVQNEVQVFKEMTDVYIPPSNFLVTPFLGITKNTPSFKTNHEVENIIEVTLSDLTNDAFQSATKITTSYATNWEVPCFIFNNHIVWGATAMMLSEIKELFKTY